MRIVHSTAFFKHPNSTYESEQCGVAKGIFYVNFLPALVRAHHHAFKGWELWIHHDQKVKEFKYFRILTKMADKGLLRLIDMGHANTLTGSMLWRMSPLFDGSVDFFISRDLDSLPMERDRVMVEEAIKHKAAVHCILDSESHCGPLMGGMTGWDVAKIRELVPEWTDLPTLLGLANKCTNLNKLGGDQRYLNKEIWPKVKSQTFIHQRRVDVMYPEAMETRPIAPQITELDKIIRHIGAGYSVENTLKYLSGHRSNPFIEMCENGNETNSSKL